MHRQARRDESLDMAKTIAAETLKMQNRENREKDWARDAERNGCAIFRLQGP